MKIKHLLPIGFCLAMATNNLLAEVVPNSLFSSHAVLQRGVDLPVWGTAKDGEKVTVEFAGQKKETVAADGKWMVHLKPLKAGGPFVMVLKGDNTVTLTDILVGEVWICSGQSNMERQVGPRQGQKPIIGWEKERDEANYPEIRQYMISNTASDKPVADAKSKWVVCSPQSVVNFTAVGYFFGKDLHKKLKVPVGLLFSSVGGTPAEFWTSYAAMSTNPDLKRATDGYERTIQQYPAQLAKYKQEEPALLAKYQHDYDSAKLNNKPQPRRPTEPRDPAKTGNAGGLYNAMIKPYTQFAIKGVVWYQGEANNSDAPFYQKLFPAMIADWRKDFAQGDFPFLFVQIAPFMGMRPDLREAQLYTWQHTPNTSMVVITDIGDSADIHPADKVPVGQRLALAAEALAYKEKIEYSGPIFKTLKIDGANAILDFTHYKKLVAKDGPLTGFVIAGADKVFVPATAVIKGNTIVVNNINVAVPVAVRFGWSNVPHVNLYNEADLPASPFRTDSVVK